MIGSVISIIIILGMVVVLFNRLVAARHRVLAAWSDIDVQLKRRHDLIPKLVDAVKQYAGYEQAVLTTVVELRDKSEALTTVAEKANVESSLGQGIHNLLALAEAYPDLKANQNFLQLQNDITEVEDNIQYARRYYNGAVKALNVRVESFPDNLVAKLFGFHTAEYFDMEE
ncbi:MAG: LemA family protein [Gammaproteobacteria bacterium]|jgi:LemA protein